MADMLRRVPLRFSVRSLVTFVTLVCLYFSAWKMTDKYGVVCGVDDPPNCCYYESCPMPFVIRRYVDTGDDRYYVWIFGAELTLPF